MTNTIEKSQKKIEATPVLLDLILLLIAVLLLSLDPIFTRLSENELGFNATVFNREWIASVVLVLWQGIKILSDRQPRDLQSPQESDRITISTIAILVAAVVMGEASLVTWALSLTQTGVANSNLLHNLPSVFAVLGGWLFLGQRFDARFLIGMTIALGGAIAIGVEDLRISPENLVGDAWALFSAVIYAGYFLVIEKLRGRFSTLTISLWCCILASFILLPIVIIFEDKVFPTSVSGWATLISLGVFCQVISSVIFVYQLKHFSSAFVSLFMLLEPIITAVLAWFVFQEKLNLLNWIAFFVVLLGIYVAQSGEGSQKSNESSALNS
jgi:drug/metabolite transporter (DMT)-like permease